MRMQLFPRTAALSPKTVDNLGKTVDNLTRLWITSNVYSIMARAESNAYPHIWGVHLFQTQITKIDGSPPLKAEQNDFFIQRYPQVYSTIAGGENQKMWDRRRGKSRICGKICLAGHLSTYPQPLLFTTRIYTF